MPQRSHWREHARAVVARVLSEAAELNLDDAATRRRLSAAYPFGERKYHPYKIWLDECRRQLAPTVAAAQRERPTFYGPIVDTQEYTLSATVAPVAGSEQRDVDEQTVD